MDEYNRPLMWGGVALHVNQIALKIITGCKRDKMFTGHDSHDLYGFH